MEEEVLTSEREDDGGCDRDALLRIAELCNCDLRGILNAMQLHCHGSLSLSAAAAAPRKSGRRGKEEGSGDASQMTSRCLNNPEISEVSPSIIDGSSHSVLTIRGRNFLGTCEWARIQVIIDGHPSPMLRVVDDTTILAISPPCDLPEGVDSSGIFEMTFEPCITSRHLPILVTGTTRTGIVAHSDSALVSVPGKHWNVTYSFSEPSGRLESVCKKREEARGSTRGEDAFSSDEEDFVIPTSTRTTCRADEEKKADEDLEQDTITSVVSMTSENEALPPDHNDHLAALLEKASNDLVLDVHGVASKLHHEQTPLKCDFGRGEIENQNAVNEHDGEEKVAQELEQLVKELEIASDAVLLEEGLYSMATPTPSGAARGFASDFIDPNAANGFRPSTTNPPRKLRNAPAARP